MQKTYIHGYDQRESRRLQDQASTLTELLHADTFYPEGSRVLEAGCGVGAQTVTLAQNSPHADIISVDISEASIAQARERVETARISNVKFQQAD
ncbi:MAG: class I SAM-dependent methyltransferase, partial [Dissulfurispiraceae bacterium]